MNEPTIEQMKEELVSAGWRAKTPTIWASPKKKLFLGPYGAWKVMKGIGNFNADGSRRVDAVAIE